jgi:preprotein translocase subunit YajC
MKKIQYIFVFILIAIVIAFLIMFFTKKSPEDIELEEKMKETDKMFNTWIGIAGESDKQYLKTNELPIKTDINTKLRLSETQLLNSYTNALNDFLLVKNTPLNPLFLTSSAYLISNFNKAKDIVGKTGIKDWFNKIAFSNLPNQNK